MTQPTNKQVPIFPDMPRGTKFLDEDGKVHPEWLFYLDQMQIALTRNFKPEGFVIPPQSASNIARLTSPASNNNIIFDSTNGVFKGNVNGIWYTFETSAPLSNAFLLLGT